MRPDVIVREKLVSYTPPSPSVSRFYGALVGTANKGPVDRPLFLSAWGDYQSFYGGLSSDSPLSLAVYQYFANGGGPLFVSRVEQSGATASSVDIAATGGTDPWDLTVSAMSPGVWGDTLKVEFVHPPNADANSYNINIYDGGVLVETWLDRSLEEGSARYIGSLNSTTSGSRYIRISAPDGADGTLPATAKQLTSGAIGTTSDGTDWLEAVDRLRQVDALLTLGTPGATSLGTGYKTFVDTVITRIDPSLAGSAPEAFANNVFYVIDTESGKTAAEMVSFATGLQGTSYAAVYGPWLGIIDPLSSVPGNTRSVEPSGSVIGQYIKTDSDRSVGKIAAGVSSRIAGCVNVETRFVNSDLDLLNDNAVNIIRPIPGGNFSIMGGRTLHNGVPDRYINIRRSLLYITSVLKQRTAFAIFEGNTPALRNSLTLTCIQFLLAEQAGGVLADVPSPGAFYVVCGDTNNTPQTIAAGEVHIEVGVALTAPAEYIIINLVHYEGGSVQVTTTAQA